MSGFYCLKCNESAVYVYANDGHHFGCRGRVIPIATLCNEPTIIDESDLAPGMVGVIESDWSSIPYVVRMPNVDIGIDSTVLPEVGRLLTDDADVIRWVAGKVTP